MDFDGFYQQVLIMFSRNPTRMNMELPFYLMKIGLESTLHPSLNVYQVGKSENVIHYELKNGETKITDLTLTRKPDGSSIIAITPDGLQDLFMAKGAPSLSSEDFHRKTAIADFLTRAYQWVYEHRTWDSNSLEKDNESDKTSQPLPIDTHRTRRAEWIDNLCISWAGRDYLSVDNMDEFLAENNKDTGEFISKSEFKRALKNAFARGLITKKNNRYRPKN